MTGEPVVYSTEGGAMKIQTSPRLIANTLPARGNDFKTVHRQLGQAGIVQKARGERMGDPFAIKDRTMDQVVDCLLKELSW
jgi:hypothetical protein